MVKKFVFMFDDESENANKSLLGYKGLSMAELTSLGFPIPYGFTIIQDACIDYHNNSEVISSEIVTQIEEALKNLEARTKKYFGNEEAPLLVSVRTSSTFNITGTMNTILNIGLNDVTVKALVKLTNNKKFAYDLYSKLIEMISVDALGIPKYHFEDVISEIKNDRKIKYNMEFSTDDMVEITNKYKQIYKEQTGKEFPQDIKEQIYMVIKSSYNYWNNPKAIVYRRMHSISNNVGVAITIQQMVFGNIEDNSGVGIVFTRNPFVGEKGIFGEYLVNAQGEEIISGLRTPSPISELRNTMPNVYKQLKECSKKLERYYKDMQEVEFTIENKRLFILQTKNANRTSNAAFKIAVDLVKEGIITEKEALMRINPKIIEDILYPYIDRFKSVELYPICKGIPVSPGAVTGRVYFSIQTALKAHRMGERVILVTDDNIVFSTTEIKAINGLLCSKGSTMSYVASLCRRYKRPCIGSCNELSFNNDRDQVIINRVVIKEGDYITIDGNSGYIYNSEINVIEPQITEEYIEFMKWADEIRKIEIRANADGMKDIKTALEMQVEGIGLFRPEYIFADKELIENLIYAITINESDIKNNLIRNLISQQKELYVNLFNTLKEKKVTIRMMDPNIEEIFSLSEAEIKNIVNRFNIDENVLKKSLNKIINEAKAFTFKGCRLLINFPELIEYQIRPLIEAAVQVKNETKINIMPEIIIPFVTEKKEFSYIKNYIIKIIDSILRTMDEKLLYRIGALVETPRAVMIADELAKESEFFAFGTSDLTFMTYGILRESGNNLIDSYNKSAIYDNDPFKKIDEQGVGKLIKFGIESGRKTRENLVVGICGYQAGDPESIKFFKKIGVNYISCPTYKIPMAKLAAAQAEIEAS